MADDPYACLEDNDWTPILHPALDGTHPLVRKLAALDPAAPVELATDPFTLSLAAIDAAEYHRVDQEKRLVFHTFGCSGDPMHEEPQARVAAALAQQTEGPDRASFLYHLGDIAYKPDQDKDQSGDAADKDQAKLYREEFYRAYNGYSRPIFAIPGNHDGKYHEDKDEDHRLVLAESSMWHFLLNFCAPAQERSPDGGPDAGERRTMIQPYPFWVLATPLAYVVGLYTNVANGGCLDDPSAEEYPHGIQYHWLVNRLKAIRLENERRVASGQPRKAVLLALHYPPYSAASNFVMRGDPRFKKPTKKHPDKERHPQAVPLANLLRRAFDHSGQAPDLILSAHAHLYQRLTYQSGERQIPVLIVGSGGHAPVESMASRCGDLEGKPSGESPESGKKVEKERLPAGLEIPDGEHLRLERYHDGPDEFGFLRMTVTSKLLKGEFFLPQAGSPVKVEEPVDSFTLDLKTLEVR